MLISNFSTTTKRKAHTRKVKGKIVQVKESKAEKFANAAKNNKLSRAIRDWEYATRGVRHLSMSGTAVADTVRRNSHLALQLRKEAKLDKNNIEGLAKKAREVGAIRRAIGI